jgi:hypothetical protein
VTFADALESERLALPLGDVPEAVRPAAPETLPLPLVDRPRVGRLPLPFAGLLGLGLLGLGRLGLGRLGLGRLGLGRLGVERLPLRLRWWLGLSSAIACCSAAIVLVRVANAALRLDWRVVPRFAL